MRYVYMVTTITEGLPEGFRCIPNLGAHSSLESAVKHFKGVLADRKRFASDVTETITPEYGDFPYSVVRSASVQFKEGYYSGRFEEIRLERWRLGRKKGRT